MSLILHIDTAVEAASICLSMETSIIAEVHNPQSRESASWLQPAIKGMLEKSGYTLQQVKAVSVSAGPGSYTGLRVGMASAKGLCYALNIPLITIDTLEMMTVAAMELIADDALFCPLIDARRMEVFTAMYNRKLQPLLPPQNMILAEHSFLEWLQQSHIYFFGNGSTKLKPLVKNASALFVSVHAGASNMVQLAYNKYCLSQFADIAYAEPFYIKAFYTTQPRS